MSWRERLHHTQLQPEPPARVIVIGARGFVGGAVVARLQQRDIPVLALTSADTDLLDPAAVGTLESYLKPDDAVVFVSALTPDKGKDTGTFMKNLTMAQHVADALRRVLCAHLVYISSDAVYSDSDSVVSEDSCCQPDSFHGLMHISREHMLADTVDGPIAILRPSLLYGARDTHNGYGPNRFRRQAETDGTIPLFGEGEEKRDHVYINDLADMVALCLLHRSTGVLNVATGQSVSFQEVAQLTAACFQNKIAIQGSPRQMPITHRHFDTTACQTVFPSFHFTSIADGIARACGGED